MTLTILNLENAQMGAIVRVGSWNGRDLTGICTTFQHRDRFEASFTHETSTWSLQTSHDIGKFRLKR